MAKDKEKEVAPKFNFPGTIAQSKYRVVGVPLLTSNGKVEKTLEETVDEAEKADILSARKEVLVSKMEQKAASVRKQGEPKPKRFTVDPETGRIDIDEEGGDYTQKEALMVSASIKGKGGQYDAAIALITAAKALVPDNQPSVAEKPKEFYVDPETGVIIKDSENGEYTLSEARTISQSLKKEKQAAPPEQKSFLDKLEEISQGMISQRIAKMLGGDSAPPHVDPVEEVINRLNQADKLKERFTGGGAQALAQTGVRGEILKLMLEDERDRLKMQYEHEAQVDRNKALLGLTQTVKENLSDGIAAIRMAAAEFKTKGAGEKIEAPQPQQFICGTCKTPFGPPAGWAGQPLKCPNPACGREYSKEELLA